MQSKLAPSKQERRAANIFCNGKTQYQKNTNRLRLDDNSITSDQKEIAKELVQFYKELHTSAGIMFDEAWNFLN